ncbi:MAG TPA: M36 family metallopeptidase [Verrucomicrobiae bacterium]|nr:M36 family metallopeptidase [Verrucomicrobiae bacterium]
MNRTTLRMCWRVVLTGRTSGKLFQVLVDAANGEVLVRHCWTKNAVEATYLVFDKDSAAPLLPGWSTPSTTQAPVTTQVNLTLTALSANASPAGWVNTNPAIFGLTNTTFGNNIDAYLDWTNASPAYGSANVLVPRPLGVLTNGRVEFTGPSFAVDFNQHPTNSPNRDVAVVNAFYWCNWMHDVLYELGFTEAAGNFQYDNWGRGGTDGDPVLMHVQTSIGSARGGGITSNSPLDGQPGDLWITLWGGIEGRRDGVLDTTIILHEYTHFLTQRLVGGGSGISEFQTLGLSEGWSDFFALSLLSSPEDDVHGCYQLGGFASYHHNGSFEQNYYFGGRAYPYSTDLLKNPMTLNGLELVQNDYPHPSVPLSPLYMPGNFRINEEHTHALIWAGALWDARANLIQKIGFSSGNWSMLELTTDAMKLGPPNPTFLQARDFVLLANLYTNAAQHHLELWTAFAKRGMGYTALVTEGTNDFPEPPTVLESFSIPPFVEITNSTHASATIAPDGTAYIGSSDGWFYSLVNDGTNKFMLSDPTNTFLFLGKIKWSFGGMTTSQSFNSSPAIGPTGVVYVGCNDSNLYAIASSGTMIWRTNLGGEIVSSPALANDGTIYVGSGDGKLYAVNPDGTVKWSTSSTGSNILSSPAIALSGTIYVGSMYPTTNLYAFNPTNGAVLSGWPVTVTNGVHSSPAIGSDGSIYVGGLDGKVCAFTTNGTPKSGWPVTTGGAIWSSPAIGSNGVVYIGSTDSNLYAINPNGTTNWTYKTRGAVRSSPALGRDGTVFVGSDDFNLHVINADGTGRWQYPIGGPVVSSPVIGLDGGLFVGSTAGNLYYLPTGTPFADGPWPMFRQNFRHTANANTVILRRPQVSGGGLNIEVAGPMDAQCAIETTTSFTPSNWSTVTTVTLTNGVGSFQVSPTNVQSFFRAVTD